MIIHRTARDDFTAYQTALVMDEMGHKIVSIVCRRGAKSDIIGAIPDEWHVYSQGEEINTSELDKRITEIMS